MGGGSGSSGCWLWVVVAVVSGGCDISCGGQSIPFSFYILFLLGNTIEGLVKEVTSKDLFNLLP